MPVLSGHLFPCPAVIVYIHAGKRGYHANLLLHVSLVWELGQGALHLNTVTFLHTSPTMEH